MFEGVYSIAVLVEKVLIKHFEKYLLKRKLKCFSLSSVWYTINHLERSNQAWARVGRPLDEAGTGCG